MSLTSRAGHFIRMTVLVAAVTSAGAAPARAQTRSARLVGPATGGDRGGAATTATTASATAPAPLPIVAVTLPFEPDDLRPSDDGSHVVALRFAPRDDAATPGPLLGVGRVALAVYDGDHATVIADRPVPDQPVVATVDAERVYVGCLRRHQVLVLEGPSLGVERSIPLDGPPVALACVADRLFVAYSNPTRSGFGWERRVYRLPDLAPADDPLPGPPADPRISTPEVGGFRPDSFGVPAPAGAGNRMYDGVIYDWDLRHARLLPDGMPFVRLTPRPARYDRVEAVDRPAPWDVHVINGALLRTGGQRVVQLAEPYGFDDLRPARVLTDRPSLAVLQESFAHSVDPRETWLVSSAIKLVDLSTGRPAAAAPFTVARDVPRVRAAATATPFRWGPDTAAVFRLAGDGASIIVGSGQQLVRVPTGRPEFGSNATEPLHFRIEADRIPTFGPGATLTIAAHVRGGTPPLRFDLEENPPGIEVDPQSGTVTLQGPTLVGGAREDLRVALLGTYHTLPNRDGNFSLLSVAASAEGYLRIITPLFQSLVGRKPTGLPVAVRLTLVARDAASQAVTLTQYALLEVPVDDVVRYVETQKAAASGVTGRVSAAAGETAVLRWRIHELEQQNRDLQVKVDAMLEQARRPHGPGDVDAPVPATRPADPPAQQ